MKRENKRVWSFRRDYLAAGAGAEPRQRAFIKLYQLHDINRAARFAARVIAPRLAAADRRAFCAFARAAFKALISSVTASSLALMAAMRSQNKRYRSSNSSNGSATGIVGASATTLRHEGQVVARSSHDDMHLWWNTRSDKLIANRTLHGFDDYAQSLYTLTRAT